MLRPFCRVEFATLAESPDLISARIIRAAYSHEIVILRFKSRNLSSRNFRSDIPVTLTWGFYPRYREEFVGYVHHVDDEIRQEQGSPTMPSIDVVAVGATRPLRNERPRNWGTTRLSNVVETAALEARLGYDVDPSTQVYETLMQSSQSLWSFLVEHAQQEGMLLGAQGTRVFLWDMDERMPVLKKHAPVFSYRSNDVRSFEPVLGEMNPSENEAATREAYALSLSGGERGRFSGTMSGFSTGIDAYGQSLSGFLNPEPKFGSVRAGEVLSSPSDVREELSVTQKRTERIYQAKIDLMAWPPLRPGDPMVIDGYGSRQSGYWITDRIEFKLNTEKITTNAEVSRRESRDTGERPGAPGTKSPYRRRVRFRLVGGRWVDRG